MRFRAKLKLQEAVSAFQRHLEHFGAVSDVQTETPSGCPASSFPDKTGKFGDFGNGLHQYYLGPMHADGDIDEGDEGDID